MSSEYKINQKKCQALLKLPEIRFAGFLDVMGLKITATHIEPE